MINSDCIGNKLSVQNLWFAVHFVSLNLLSTAGIFWQLW